MKKNNHNMTLIKDFEINEILQGEVKPQAYSGKDFPLTELNARTFEILLYQIFKAQIEAHDSKIIKSFNGVSLMQGVGEKGMDCILLNHGKNVGLIQCKQINRNLAKPEVIREITKFSINAIIDKTLNIDINNFTYYLAVSKGLAGSTISLLNDFNNKIFSEPKLDEIIKEVLNSYVSFRKINFNQIKPKLENLFRVIKVKYIIPSDINKYLFDHETLIKSFFRVLTVTDNSLLENIISTYLEPTLKKLYPQKTKDVNAFSFRFKEYLERSLNKYSSSRTIIFGNQQKKLEDFYYPLTLICKNEKLNKSDKFFNTLKYEENFIPYYKKVLIVDSGGMGKSTLMKWLFISVLKQKKGIPIFIELRKLKKHNLLINEIINELKPLDIEIETEFITKLIVRGNFIFFLDGYDEISEENRSIVTTDLQQFISKSSNNLFILTSRPETAINSFSDFQEFNIKKLNLNEATELILKLGDNGEKALRLINMIKKNRSVNFDEFLQNPLLISILFRKFDYRETLPLKLQEFYYDVFEALFQTHDLTKGDSFIREKKTKLALSEFFQVLREVGFYTFKIDDLEYNQTTFSNYLDEISVRIPHIKFESFEFMDDIVKSVPLFIKEGIIYKWSHKSFQEYFAAEFICRDTKEKQIPILKKMYKSKRSHKFNLVFSLCYDIDFKSFKKAILYDYILDFVNHYDNTYKYLSTTIPKEEVDKRKSLTFNKYHKFIYNKKNDFTSYFNISEQDMLNPFEIIEKKMNKSLPKDYYLNGVLFGLNYILLTAIKDFNLFDFLIEKKSDLLLELKVKDSREYKLTQNIIVSDDINSEINSPIIFSEINDMLFPFQKPFIYNIQRCREFIYEIEKELSLDDNEYIFNGI